MAAQFGLRLRKGAATTALAAVAVAALAASQAPGVTTDSAGRQAAGAPSPEMSTLADDTASGNSPYYTDLPPLDSPTPTTGTGDTSGTTGGSERGIPATVLDAYKKAEASLRESKPGCNLPWQLLAAIGKVESGQARGGRVDAERHDDRQDPRPPAQRQRLREHQRHRQRRLRRRQHARPSRRPDAVHPVHLGVGGPRRQRRRREGPQQRLRRRPRRRPLPVPLRLGPVERRPTCAARSSATTTRRSTQHRPVVAGVLPQGHPRDPGRHRLPARDAERRQQQQHRQQQHRQQQRQWRKRQRRLHAEPRPQPHAAEGQSEHRRAGAAAAPPPRPRRPPPRPRRRPPPPTRCTTWRTRARRTSRPWPATPSPASSSPARRPRRARPSRRSGSASPIVGDTDTTFTGGEKVATVITDSAGMATAPALVAGEKTGDFTVRATVVGRSVAALDYKVTVTARRADALARTGTTALTCVPSGEFAEQVEVKATYRGADRGQGRRHRDPRQVARSTPPRTTRAPTSRTRTASPYAPWRAWRRTRTACSSSRSCTRTTPPARSCSASSTEGGATLTVELKVEAAAEPTETATPTESVTPSPSES